MNLAYYGETREQMEERIAKKAREELLQKQNRQMILKLYYEHKWGLMCFRFLIFRKNISFVCYCSYFFSFLASNFAWYKPTHAMPYSLNRSAF